MSGDNFEGAKLPDGGEENHGLHHVLLDLKQQGTIEFHEDDRDEDGDPTMSLSDDGRGAAVDLLQNNDDAVLFLLKLHFGKEFDDLESVTERDLWEAVVDVAKTLRDDGVNLFRVLKRNSEKVPNIDVGNVPLSIIKHFDPPETGGNEDTESDDEPEVRTDGGTAGRERGLPERFDPIWVCERCGYEASTLAEAFTHEDSTAESHVMVRPDGFDQLEYYEWKDREIHGIVDTDREQEGSDGR